MRNRLIGLLVTLATLLTALTFAPVVVQASHGSNCTNTPYVWFYSQSGWFNQGSEYDEIKFCYNQFPNTGFTDLKVSGGGPATHSPERCEGLFGFHDGNFDDCLSSLSTSNTGWGSGKTLCLYVNTFYNKNEGWSYISSDIGEGNLDSSLNDKISSLRWVSGGSAAC